VPTGRSKKFEPNAPYHKLPPRTELGESLKKALDADRLLELHEVPEADYSEIEIRLAAHGGFAEFMKKGKL
jgi:DNA polymerase I-like protein with 3'-5' exonuclease and polymerase domains